MDQNGTGIEYPTITLGGKVYTLKFTRGGIMYRLSKTGVNLADMRTAQGFSASMDFLHAALYGQYDGSPEQLAEIVMEEGKMLEVSGAIAEALKKVFPSATPTPEVMTETPAALPVH